MSLASLDVYKNCLPTIIELDIIQIFKKDSQLIIDFSRTSRDSQ